MNCKSCGQLLTITHAAIHFVKCACGHVTNILNNKLEPLADDRITRFTPSFLKIGQRGNIAGKGFVILGRAIIWSEESTLSYWTLLFDNNTLQILEEGYGNFAILENYTKEAVTLSKHTNVKHFKPNNQFELKPKTKVNVDINSDIFYTDIEGQFSGTIASPEQILYCGSIVNDKTYELWLQGSAYEVYYINGLSFDELNLEGDIDEHLQFPNKMSCACKKCNTEFEVPYFPYVQTATCPDCKHLYAYDIKSNGWKPVMNYSKSQKEVSTEELPIGAHITLLQDDFEVIGKAYRVNKDGYYWLEYHLWCAAEGSFAYLSESDGHFTLLYELFEPPAFTNNYSKKVHFFKKTFNNYDIYTAQTVSVVGNLIGSYLHPMTQVQAYDYVSPPYMLSLELGKYKANHWHFGEYVPKVEIKKAFAKYNVRVPYRSGYGATRPANKFALSEIWLITAIMALIYIGIQIYLLSSSHHVQIAQTSGVTDSIVNQIIIDDINIQEDRSEINIASGADVSNEWLMVNYTLINKKTGTEYDGGKEISYYFGSEGGESWSEGSRKGNYKFSGIDKGNYKLVSTIELNPESINKQVDYNLIVTTDSQLGKNFWFPLLLIIGWAVFATIKYFIVESHRMS